jgi:hypothetical protein
MERVIAEQQKLTAQLGKAAEKEFLEVLEGRHPSNRDRRMVLEMEESVGDGEWFRRWRRMSETEDDVGDGGECRDGGRECKCCRRNTDSAPSQGSGHAHGISPRNHRISSGNLTESHQGILQNLIRESHRISPGNLAKSRRISRNLTTDSQNLTAESHRISPGNLVESHHGISQNLRSAPLRSTRTRVRAVFVRVGGSRVVNLRAWEWPRVGLI